MTGFVNEDESALSYGKVRAAKTPSVMGKP